MSTSKHTAITNWTFVNNYLTSCRPDGSISINAVICAEVVADSMPVEAKRLIEAAPDLLKALEGVVAIADRKTKEFDVAHAAIAKARGDL